MKSIWTRSLAFALAFAALLPAWARPVPPEDAAAAAQGWLTLNEGGPLQAKMGTGGLAVTPVPDAAGGTLFYVAALDQGGTVVLAPDDAVEPVIAFSEAPLDLADPDPCNHLRVMLEKDLAERLAGAAGVTDEKAVTGKALQWAALIAAGRDTGVKGGLGSVSDVRVNPLTRTQWSQLYVYQGATKLACYNYFTPPSQAGYALNYYCGCVGTALAQIMRYHRYPKTGVGTPACTIQIDSITRTRKLKGGDGAGGAYDWANMPEDPAGLAQGGNLSLAQRKAIGYLCHDAAVASEANFTIDGTSAYLLRFYGKHALQTIFKYANCDSAWPATGYSLAKADLNRAVNSSLDAGMPCALAIQDDQAIGHAVVVDGYGYSAGTLYHHLNLGWGGYETAWYNLPTVPADTRTYTHTDGILFNINPSHSNMTVISGRILGPAGAPVAGAKVVAKHVGAVYPNVSGLSNSRGIYALIVHPGQYQVRASLAGYGFTPEARTLTTGADLIRNVWNSTFRRVTRVMRLSSAKLSFGTLSVGASKALTLQVYNDGTAPLRVDAVTLPDGFSYSPEAPFYIPNGSAQPVKVTFAPGTAGWIKGDMVLKSNKSGGVSQLAVQGTGL